MALEEIGVLSTLVPDFTFIGSNSGINLQIPKGQLWLDDGTKTDIFSMYYDK